jgi:crossover junction endodeoxyribonuclease RuvC
MRILGIDPGTATTGYGMIMQNEDEYKALSFGCITTKAGLPLEQRLQEIANDLVAIIKKTKPDEAAIEEIFFSKNVKTAISVAHARGVIIHTLQQNNIPIQSYNPMQIKKAICSDGSANKTQIQKMTQLLLQLETIPTPDDAADALAIAICHGNHIRNNSLYQKAA